MQIKVNVKQLGKKRPVIAEKVIEVNDFQEFTLQELITNLVEQQVDAFNQRIENNPIIPFLLDAEIVEKAETGKVGFGAIFNDEKAHKQKAIENALQSFQDGIFVVFIDETELTNLNQTFVLQQDSVFTFVRLTFLSGLTW